MHYVPLYVPERAFAWDDAIQNERILSYDEEEIITTTSGNNPLGDGENVVKKFSKTKEDGLKNYKTVTEQIHRDFDINELKTDPKSILETEQQFGNTKITNESSNPELRTLGMLYKHDREQKALNYLASIKNQNLDNYFEGFNQSEKNDLTAFINGEKNFSDISAEAKSALTKHLDEVSRFDISNHIASNFFVVENSIELREALLDKVSEHVVQAASLKLQPDSRHQDASEFLEALFLNIFDPHEQKSTVSVADLNKQIYYKEKESKKEGVAIIKIPIQSGLNDFNTLFEETKKSKSVNDNVEFELRNEEKKDKIPANQKIDWEIGEDVEEICFSINRFINKAKECADGTIYAKLEKLESKITFNNISINNEEYEITAFIRHTGSLYAGHYMTYVKEKDEQWYCYDDQHYGKDSKSGTKVDSTELELAMEDAYIVKYSKKGDVELLPGQQDLIENDTGARCWLNSSVIFTKSFTTALSSVENFINQNSRFSSEETNALLKEIKFSFVAQQDKDSEAVNVTQLKGGGDIDIQLNNSYFLSKLQQKLDDIGSSALIEDWVSSEKILQYLKLKLSNEETVLVSDKVWNSEFITDFPDMKFNQFMYDAKLEKFVLPVSENAHFVGMIFEKKDQDKIVVKFFNPTSSKDKKERVIEAWNKIRAINKDTQVSDFQEYYHFDDEDTKGNIKSLIEIFQQNTKFHFQECSNISCNQQKSTNDCGYIVGQTLYDLAIGNDISIKSFDQDIEANALAIAQTRNDFIQILPKTLVSSYCYRIAEAIINEQDIKDFFIDRGSFQKLNEKGLLGNISLSQWNTIANIIEHSSSNDMAAKLEGSCNEEVLRDIIKNIIAINVGV
ncbi:putative hydrolase [Candidatus Cyrtobacter comes]|uniref:Hydrolase n=1 Tax=Candidatus Cyrtobacter comes TaxID=675776 RepID=A0ABU5L9K3_9RICK|nr:hypothetical protein [Candidatus Cyrtobacter comes]MDZ5762806.1 putative hydrolase [Candidatus Cyrtobacter comes]